MVQIQDQQDRAGYHWQHDKDPSHLRTPPSPREGGSDHQQRRKQQLQREDGHRAEYRSLRRSDSDRAAQLVCLQDVDEVPHGFQCAPQLVGAYLSSDPVGERPLDEADATDRPIAGFGADQ
jgi:hypothetical protein